MLLAVMLNVTVNYLLILGAGGLCGQTPALGRALLGGVIGAIHGALCFIPGLGFLGHSAWRLVSVALMGLAAFGCKQLRLQAVLLALCLGLDGVVMHRDIRGTLAGLCAAVLIGFLLRGKKEGTFVPVRLHYGQKELELLALRDTGNRLIDPITGGSVLVIGAQAAEKLTGLTVGQLKDPLHTMGQLPGLRLIPYNAVGSRGFLLGLRLPKVKIGNWQGSQVVAFAPAGLEGNVQALIGGTI